MDVLEPECSRTLTERFGSVDWVGARGKERIMAKRDVVKDIRRATRRKFSAEEKIRLLPVVQGISGGGKEWPDP